MQAIRLTKPLSVYINWAAYDTLSDNVPLTEKLAMEQLTHLLRLKKRGVQFDYYMMDANWYDPDGGYRTFHKKYWPKGPDRWLKTCLKNGIKPGLWVATNNLNVARLNPVKRWEGSYDSSRANCSFFEGPYLGDFIDVLQRWYDRGVRMFKFDFFVDGAMTPASEGVVRHDTAIRRNSLSLRTALIQFREKNPEVKFLAYNGFGGDMTGTDRPVTQNVDIGWLDAFDSMYCGDPRPSDVPCMNFWRSKDIYSDHMVRYFESNGVPLERIDSSGFMIGTTGTCYYRGKQAWKGMLVLSLARGNMMNTYYGNLNLLSDADGRWFAKAQRMFFHARESGKTESFGVMPGQAEPYGFVSRTSKGSVYTVVNPSQSFRTTTLPGLAKGKKRLLFHDSKRKPVLKGAELTLGPEQMAVVGVGEYAAAKYELGIESDVGIARSIKPLVATWETIASRHIRAVVKVARGKALRVVVRQVNPDGTACRSSGGSPPNGATLGTILKLTAEQDGRGVPVRIEYDKAIWSGLSWATGHIDAESLKSNSPVTIQATTSEKRDVRLSGSLFIVND